MRRSSYGRRRKSKNWCSGFPPVLFAEDGVDGCALEALAPAERLGLYRYGESSMAIDQTWAVGGESSGVLPRVGRSYLVRGSMSKRRRIYTH
jgi:hypothetical protein